MIRRFALCLVLALGGLTMTSSAAHAQQLLPPQPGYHAASECCWTERVFAIALRARWFANSMERRGYIVQVQRLGLFQWSVRYRQA